MSESNNPQEDEWSLAQLCFGKNKRVMQKVGICPVIIAGLGVRDLAYNKRDRVLWNMVTGGLIWIKGINIPG